MEINLYNLNKYLIKKKFFLFTLINGEEFLTLNTINNIERYALENNFYNIRKILIDKKFSEKKFFEKKIFNEKNIIKIFFYKIISIKFILNIIKNNINNFIILIFTNLLLDKEIIKILKKITIFINIPNYITLNFYKEWIRDFFLYNNQSINNNVLNYILDNINIYKKNIKIVYNDIKNISLFNIKEIKIKDIKYILNINYDFKNLISNIILGNIILIFKIIKYFKNTNISLTLIIWYVSYSIEIMIKIKNNINNINFVNNIINKFNLYFDKNICNNIIKLNLDNLYNSLQKLFILDINIKNNFFNKLKYWDSLNIIIFKLLFNKN